MLGLHKGDLYQVNFNGVMCIIEIAEVYYDDCVFYFCHDLESEESFLDKDGIYHFVDFIVENAAVTRHIGFSKNSHKPVTGKIGDCQTDSIFGEIKPGRSIAEAIYNAKNSIGRLFAPGYGYYIAALTDWSNGQEHIVNL